MKLTTGKIIVFTAVLMMIAAPAMADNHTNDTDQTDDVPEDDSDTDQNDTDDSEDLPENETEDSDDGPDGTDNSTNLVINQSQAEQTAREALSDNNWMLEDSSVEEEDGYYKFEFTAGEESEAEVRVDGSSGEVFRHEEKLDSGDSAPEVEELERVEVQNLTEAKERINELRGMVMDLRRQVAELESGSNAEVELERDNGSVEVEGEIPNGTEFEGESDRGPNENAQENINGTPGSEQADQNRPGFVSRMLGSFFG